MYGGGNVFEATKFDDVQTEDPAKLEEFEARIARGELDIGFFLDLPADPLGPPYHLRALTRFTYRVLAPAVVAFMALHPALEVEFRSSDQVKDLIKEGIDLSIRAGWLKDSGQQARKLGNFEQWLLAAPAYLAQAGTPQQPQDLANHAFIAFTPLSQPQQWNFSQTNPHTGAKQQVSQYLPAALKTSSTQTITALMLAGAGMGMDAWQMTSRQ